MKIQLFELFHHADWLTVTDMRPVYLYMRPAYSMLSRVVYVNKVHKSTKHDEMTVISQQ